MRCAVSPVSDAPLISDQITGENPVNRGSSESCRFSVPWGGRSNSSRGNHVRQLLATMMSGSASFTRSIRSGVGRCASSTSIPFDLARSSTESAQIDSYRCSLTGWVTTSATSCSDPISASRVLCPHV